MQMARSLWEQTGKYFVDPVVRRPLVTPDQAFFKACVDDERAQRDVMVTVRTHSFPQTILAATMQHAHRAFGQSVPPK